MNDRRGSNNPNWKGGSRQLLPNGYVRVWVSPYKYAYEHRVLMERHLGRQLLPSEDVHHINGIKNDNRLENLQVMPHVDHLRQHAPRCLPHQSPVEPIPCPICGTLFKPLARNSEHRQLACSRRCSRTLMHREGRGRWRNHQPVMRDCEWCGNAFQPLSKTSRFCSKSCTNKHRWKHHPDTIGVRRPT